MIPLNRLDIYWMGGSPCSGKSSIANTLADRYGLRLFRSDDHMDQHIRQADPVRQPAMAKIARMNWEQIWMRPVSEQVADELEFYREEFDQLCAELEQFPGKAPILAEGTAWLPELLIRAGVSPARTFFLVPTATFQVQHYAQRPWARDILSECSQPQQAFQNWMDRDSRFANAVEEQARAGGMPVRRVDGTLTLPETCALIERSFDLPFSKNARSRA
jgi:2-phosphoglycerate kinase